MNQDRIYGPIKRKIEEWIRYDEEGIQAMENMIDNHIRVLWERRKYFSEK